MRDLARQRAKKPALQLPQTIEEVDESVAEIGQLQRTIQAIESEMNDKIDIIKAEYGQKADANRRKIGDLLDSVESYAAVNRNELTDDGRSKTVKLRSGLLSWRNTPPAVSISKVEEVKDRLKTLGLDQFLRTKQEIDRQAILADKEVALAVEGIRITQREEFVVTPNESQAEVIKKGKVV